MSLVYWEKFYLHRINESHDAKDLITSVKIQNRKYFSRYIEFLKRL